FFLVPNTGAPTTANVIASINHAGVYTGSDQRLKTGVQPLHYGLREVMDLAPKEYDLHLGKSIKNGAIVLQPEADHQIGFLAQDVYRVVPEAVQKPKDPANEIYKMNYSILVPVLVSAVQELKHLQDATVAEQEAKITDQETKIASLETEIANLKEANGKLAAMASKLEVLEKTVTAIQQKSRAVRTVSLSQ
ncbi:MAG TPA: tail fiber domain-containing protein, partial [Chthoniobacterales bacterium]|nr:tail fiber domain-containing protein [Chthoniobacterales bacterium]